jgi:pyruvate/2-oxoglutarate dehydrogenase complex dihydrolipoamide acyltransferase (E2) component
MEAQSMALMKRLLLSTLTLLVATATPALAEQTHVVSPASITATLKDRVDAQDTNRAAVRAALARPEVREIASQMGVDLNRAEQIANTMGGADLEQAASAARQVNDSLVGGASTIVISTTALVIVLLIVLILVAA